jgi:hypothetical protein
MKKIADPAFSPARSGSGVRRIGDESLRDGWLDQQFRMSADLLHLRMRVESAREGHAIGALSRAWAKQVVAQLEQLKDALYEVSADALAPPLAPLLTPESTLVRETWAIYAWAEGVLAEIGARMYGERPPSARPLLPTMPAILVVVEELHRVLGLEHPLFARARAHISSAYMMAFTLEAEITTAAARPSGIVPRRT